MKTPEMINRNMNTDHLKDILIVFPSSFSVNKKDELKAIINKKLQLSHVKVSKIVNE